MILLDRREDVLVLRYVRSLDSSLSLPLSLQKLNVSVISWFPSSLKARRSLNNQHQHVSHKTCLRTHCMSTVYATTGHIILKRNIIFNIIKIYYHQKYYRTRGEYRKLQYYTVDGRCDGRWQYVRDYYHCLHTPYSELSMYGAWYYRLPAAARPDPR